MPSIMVVGADHVGNMPKKLSEIGYDEVLHVSGRKCQMIKQEIPPHIDAVLVLTDFVNHNLAKAIKQKAKEKDVPIYYAKRSWCSVQKVLCECKHQCELNHSLSRNASSDCFRDPM